MGGRGNAPWYWGKVLPLNNVSYLVYAKVIHFLD
jgi:hypothetical protein